LEISETPGKRSGPTIVLYKRDVFPAGERAPGHVGHADHRCFSTPFPTEISSAMAIDSHLPRWPGAPATSQPSTARAPHAGHRACARLLVIRPRSALCSTTSFRFETKARDVALGPPCLPAPSFLHLGSEIKKRWRRHPQHTSGPNVRWRAAVLYDKLAISHTAHPSPMTRGRASAHAPHAEHVLMRVSWSSDQGALCATSRAFVPIRKLVMLY